MSVLAVLVTMVAHVLILLVDFVVNAHQNGPVMYAIQMSMNAKQILNQIMDHVLMHIHVQIHRVHLYVIVKRDGVD